jgi:hypothetical protein
VGISRDYPLKTQTSKQPNGEIPEIEIIPSHPLKYPRSKQGLTVFCARGVWEERKVEKKEKADCLASR